MSVRADIVQQAEGREVEGPTIAQLIERQKAELARVLPKHMDADRMVRIAVTLIRTTPRLADCSPPSLLGAVMLSAQLGLEPGPLGHVYFVPFYNSKLRTYEVQWMLGYKGMIELARRSGEIESIVAREVCANDDFDFAFGLEEKLEHKPAKGDRGEPVAWYAVVKYKGGGHNFEVLYEHDVNKYRARSKAKDNGPWVTDFGAMAKKTCVRRLARWLPFTIEGAVAMAHDESAVAARPGAHDVTDWIDTPAVDTSAALGALDSGDKISAGEGTQVEAPSEAASQVGSNPAPSASPAEKATKPKAPPWAKPLHDEARTLWAQETAAFVEAATDIVILFATGGRTTSAAETVKEEAQRVSEVFGDLLARTVTLELDLASDGTGTATLTAGGRALQFEKVDGGWRPTGEYSTPGALSHPALGDDPTTGEPS